MLEVDNLIKILEKVEELNDKELEALENLTFEFWKGLKYEKEIRDRRKLFSENYRRIKEMKLKWHNSLKTQL